MKTIFKFKFPSKIMDDTCFSKLIDLLYNLRRTID